MKIHISNSVTDAVIFECDTPEGLAENRHVAYAVEEAVINGVDLTRAQLSGRDLSGISLRHARLHGADMSYTNLSGTDLSHADISQSNMRGANLNRVNFYGVNAMGAHLRDADLSEIKMSSAMNLIGAGLIDANLGGEILKINPIRIQGLFYWVMITQETMIIDMVEGGCRRYTHEEWSTFSDKEIARMHSFSLGFWHTWGNCLLTLCGQHRNQAVEPLR